jgi:DNA-directed RNA polymerase subunit RPC12/RpoP
MEELASCLRCGAELELGAIIGQQLYLNWQPIDAEGGLTMHGKEHLAKGSARKGPRLNAARCPSCGLGYFQSTADA